MKSAREQLDILTAYAELGSYRAAAGLYGTPHKTVRRVIEHRAGPPAERPPRQRSADPYGDLIAARIRATDGRISAKRLLPLVRAEGYEGSARHLALLGTDLAEAAPAGPPVVYGDAAYGTGLVLEALGQHGAVSRVKV